MNFMQKVGRTAAVVGSTALALPAMAATAFTVPAEITEAEANVLLIGAAVFAIAVGIKLYKWLKRAL